MAERPRMRLGAGESWLELARTGGDEWRVTADWCSSLTADCDAFLTDGEAVDFAVRMFSHLSSPTAFAAAVTEGRNNPLRLRGAPVEDGFALFAFLTPNGDDAVCHLQTEIGPIGTEDPREHFEAFHASLTARRRDGAATRE
ncbi:hypothetical protein [Kitasatospora sp. NPDC086791]|uniref:hypothetical protein n=1 Tax=Kitasatospora sp. NPDC086791 TaxID=3155178 RepID=UPI0034239E4F